MQTVIRCRMEANAGETERRISVVRSRGGIRSVNNRRVFSLPYVCVARNEAHELSLERTSPGSRRGQVRPRDKLREITSAG